MTYLLDTHILLWYALDQSNLSTKYSGLLDQAEKKGEALGLSVITLWEIAKLVTSGRFQIFHSLDDWLLQLENHPQLQVLPLDSQIILDSMRLGKSFPNDPADQLIAATARCHGLRLMTADKRIIKSGMVALA